MNHEYSASALDANPETLTLAKILEAKKQCEDDMLKCLKRFVMLTGLKPTGLRGNSNREGTMLDSLEMDVPL